MDALYKICEGSDKGIVSHQAFIECIRKLKLPMKDGQIHRFIMICDEECTGNLKYDDFEQTIEAFGGKSEKYSNSKIPYGQECAGKLYGIMLRRSIEPLELFSLCQKGDSQAQPDTISTINCQKILAGLNTGLLQRELRSIGQFIDSRGQNSKINKEPFLKLFKNAEASWKEAARKPLLAWTQGSEIRNMTLRIDSKVQQSIQEIVSKMESTGIPIEEFIESFGDQTVVTLGKVINRLTFSYPELTKEDKISFGKLIPLNEGLVDLSTLMTFLHKFSDPNKERPINAYFQFWTNCIRNGLNLSPAEYFRKQGIQGEIDYEKFSNEIKTVVGLNDSVCRSMWKSLNEREDETIPSEDLLIVLESYINVSNNKDLANKADFAGLLEKRNMTLDDVYKLANSDTEGLSSEGKVAAVSVLRAFKKLVPELDPQLIRSRLKEKGVIDLTTEMNQEQFIQIFTTPADQLPSANATKTGFNKTKGESPDKNGSRDPLYWINKIDNAMLELGLSPTAMFQKCDVNDDGVINIKELLKVLTDVVPEDKISNKELLLVMKALDTNKNGVIEFEEFVNVFKNARSATILPGSSLGQKATSKRLPTYGNSMFVKADFKGTATSKSPQKFAAVSGIIEKVAASNFSFGELLELIQWDQEGRISVHKFMKTMEEFFGTVLATSERYMLCQYIDTAKTGFITVPSMLRFYDENIGAEEDFRRLLKLDILIMVLTFRKSGISTVKEYIQSLGLNESQRLSQGNFAAFLSKNFGFGERSIFRLCELFKSYEKDSPLISANSLIQELEHFIGQIEVVPLNVESASNEKVYYLTKESKNRLIKYLWILHIRLNMIKILIS